MTNKGYTITHCHTMFSNGITNIDSVTKYEDYINEIKDNKSLNIKGICFTEHGSVFEWYKKKELCEKNGLKYIHSIEAYLTKTTDNKVRDNYHICLYATNFESFKELNTLISKSFNREDGHYYYVPRITFEELKATSKDILITTACTGGVLSKADVEFKKEFLTFLIDNKDRCYLEQQHHLVDSQISYNKMLYEIHKNFDIPLIVATDTHSLNERHAKGRVVLQKSKNIFFDNEEGWDLTLKSYDELVELFKKQNIMSDEDIYEALENTNRLHDRVEEFTLDKSYKYPKLYDNPKEVLQRKISEGILSRGINKFDNFETEYIPRIQHEMKTYEHNKAYDFLLLDEDIKTWARTKGMFCGYSRGSCSGSEIAYLIGMTDIDSIKHNMNFERFMNTERVSLADVDTDWQPNHRDMVKKYIYEKEGLYCADIITFNTVALKGSIRDVGRALEIPLEEVSEISNNIELQEEKYRELYPELFEYVDIINGTIVSIGSHPCFLKGSLVLTSEGYKGIEEVKVGDEVLTHNNIYKEVAEVMTNQSKDLYEVCPSGSLPIETTGNHPFYIRERVERRLRKYKDGIDTIVREYKSPIWKRVDEIKKGDMVGIPVNNKSIIPNFEFDLPYSNIDLWWIVGRYLGDGWCTEINRTRINKNSIKEYKERYLVICCSKIKNEVADITTVLDKLNFKYSIQERKTVYRIYIKNKELYNYLQSFGKYAHNKFIAPEVFDLPKDLLEGLIEGYLSADGYYNQEDDKYGFKTVSKKLALGFIQCIAKVYNRHCSCCVIKSGQDIIEGRIVNRKEKYNITFTKDIRKGESSFYEGNYIWTPCKSINKINNRIETTYNLSVYDDNSYTVNNIAVHNCGLICSPIPLDSNMGLCSISTNQNPISMISMKSIDAQNYVKLDILGLDTIQIINETCTLLDIERLTPENVPDEEKVWLSMAEDNTLIFQWESDSAKGFLRNLLSEDTINKIKEVNPDFRYLDLVTMGNGAIRPAGASYRDALSKGEFRDNGHYALNDLLKSTNNYLVYQEQILEFLNKFCGYTMGEADIVRRGFAKKTGTEQFIPKIKEGFIKTMKDKYNVEEAESEELVINFLDIITSASDYLFSLNHSEPYTYIGYICAYLRYYYPLEFLTVGLNVNIGNDEKTVSITKYANKKGIQIKTPKFRHSNGRYMPSKEDNSIYKGIGSIKFLNEQVGNDLYSLRNNQYNNFLELLLDILGDKTTIDMRQLDILIKIGFFSEFGGSKYLLDIVDMFNNIYSKKQFKKDNIPTPLTIELLKKYSDKETEKLFKEVRVAEMFSELISTMDNTKDISLSEIFKTEIEFVGYISYINTSYNPNVAVVTDMKLNKFGTPFATLYWIHDGSSETIKIDKRYYNEKPISQFEVITTNTIDERHKKRKVDGKWENLEETEKILCSYGRVIFE